MNADLRTSESIETSLARVFDRLYNSPMSAIACRLPEQPSASRYDQRVSIVDGLRRAFEKFKHHRDFSRRVTSFIEAELPAFTVSVSCENRRNSVRVWGAGIDFNDSVCVTWSQLEPWVEGFAHAIDVADYRDHEERAIDEEGLCAKLSQMDAEIGRLRAQAAAMIEALPVPPSAKARANPVYWSGPSTELAERYPLLFK